MMESPNPCPTCGAKAGGPCRTRTGRRLNGEHKARRDADALTQVARNLTAERFGPSTFGRR